jgi:hypothetical protein
MPIVSSTEATSASKSPVVKLLGIKSGNAVHLVKAIERGFSFDTLEKVRRDGLAVGASGDFHWRLAAHAFAPQEREKLTAAESDRLVSVSRL